MQKPSRRQRTLKPRSRASSPRRAAAAAAAAKQPPQRAVRSERARQPAAIAVASSAVEPTAAASEQSRPGTAPPAKVTYVQAGEGEVGQRIDNFLARILKDVPRSHLYRLLRRGEVRINGRRAGASQRLAAGDRIRLPPLRAGAAAGRESSRTPSRALRQYIANAVIHEDRDLIVLNKPAGVAVHGGSGLDFGVIEALRAAHPQLTELELVHRLDRETSGCLLIAKRRAVLRELHALLRERRMEKRYLALVVGRWPFGVKTIDLPLMTNRRQAGERIVQVHAAGREAATRFEPLRHFGKVATLLDVSLQTGRTHQIRVHAAHAGHPIAGDEKYCQRDLDAKIRAAGLQRMFLHAHSLSFIRGAHGEPFTITAPLPPELQSVVERLAQR